MGEESVKRAPRPGDRAPRRKGHVIFTRRQALAALVAQNSELTHGWVDVICEVEPVGEVELDLEAFRLGLLMDPDGKTHPLWKDRAKVLLPSFCAEAAKVTAVLGRRGEADAA